jgi:squalene-hopene/tetraprenyl-beta-curcumene cyclase
MRNRVACMIARPGALFPLALAVALLAGNVARLNAAASQDSQARPAGNLSLRNETRRAIDRGVAWLGENQAAEGHWSTPDHPAITALALVAMSGAREAGLKAGEAAALGKGYDYLLSCVQPDGSIYGKPELINYNTAVSMLALLAANRTEYHPLIRNARQYLVGLQSDFGERGQIDDIFDGGVGYGGKYKHSDMSNTMQALEALYHSRHLVKDSPSAPDLNWEAAINFIQNCQNLPEYNKQTWASDDPANKGGFVYYPGYSMAGETNLPSGRVALRSYGSISYAGLLSYVYADLRRDDPRVVAVFDWLSQNFTLEENPGMGQQGLFFYYHTMAKALSAHGADNVEVEPGRKVNWREALALRLINLQEADGSWVNENGRWWEKDPALVTSYALIALEMIQRKL